MILTFKEFDKAKRMAKIIILLSPELRTLHCINLCFKVKDHK